MNYKKLSKIVSLALRHKPQQFGIKLNPEGWTDLEMLLEAIRVRNKKDFSAITKADITHIQTHFEKQRFEVKNDKIRAFYGHSVPNLIEKTPQKPPVVLFHGTSPNVLSKILKEGLLPMNRQYVHLSTELNTAQNVGSRHHHHPVILQVDTKQAYEEGVQFYHGNQNTWLSKPIPAKFLRVLKQ